MIDASYSDRVKTLVVRCREIIECDTARISMPGGKMFLLRRLLRLAKLKKSYWRRRGSTTAYAV